ncbi:hypothetical protein [Streptomyces sp. NPDC059452]|uniref:hypothetical protein n=1 Tax=Streptomyces sp. NPDC059452 TaxID=3346835 RepID=UPI003673BBC1
MPDGSAEEEEEEEEGAEEEEEEEEGAASEEGGGAAGLGAPEGVALTDGPSATVVDEEPWAVPLSGPDGPSAAPTATSRQTAHLDDHTAGSPGAMRSASHVLFHPASRTAEEEKSGHP